jgi:hypothetical protein
MTTIWRGCGPEGWHVPAVLDVTYEFCPPDSGGECPIAQLFTLQGVPDRVRRPVELGGGELRVLEKGTAVIQCKACGEQGEMMALGLEDRYVVMQCSKCGQYNWGQRLGEK